MAKTMMDLIGFARGETAGFVIAGGQTAAVDVYTYVTLPDELADAFRLDPGAAEQVAEVQRIERSKRS